MPFGHRSPILGRNRLLSDPRTPGAPGTRSSEHPCIPSQDNDGRLPVETGRFQNRDRETDCIHRVAKCENGIPAIFFQDPMSTSLIFLRAVTWRFTVAQSGHEWSFEKDGVSWPVEYPPLVDDHEEQIQGWMSLR